MPLSEMMELSIQVLEQWLTILDQEVEQGDAAIEGYENFIKQTRLNNEHTLRVKHMAEMVLAEKKSAAG